MRPKISTLFFLFIFLTLAVNSSISGQCPILTSESVDPNCTANCNVCLGDEIMISMTGEDIEDGSTIDFYIGPNGSDVSGETYLGSADITSDCTDGPQFMYALIDPPTGNDRCDEYAVIYTGGSGFDAEDIEIINSGGNPLSPYVLGNTAAFTPDCGLIAVQEGDFIPDDAILIIQTSAIGTEVYDISELCDLGLDIYVLASNNTSCAGGYFVNGSDSSYELELGCVSDILTYSAGTDAWSFLDGEGNWVTEVPNMEVPDPSTGVPIIDDFSFTITQDILDDLCSPPSVSLDVQGFLNPQVGGCSDLETAIYNLTLSCPEANTPDPIDVCEMDGDINIDLSDYNIDVAPSGGSVTWYMNANATGEIGNPGNYTGNVPVYAQVEAGGCVSEIVELEVNIFPEPNVDVSISPADGCLGDDIDIFEDGGDGVDWEWEGPGGFTSDDQNVSVNDAPAGTYTVTVTDANNCSTIESIVYDPTAGPSATVDVSSEELCQGSCIDVTFTITSGSGGPYDLLWEVNAGITLPFPWVTTAMSETWTICTYDGFLPMWDDANNELTIPDFLSFVEVELISISESGCEGTVQSDVITINVVEPPEANEAGPLTMCTMGGTDAIFDLTELDNEIGGSNDVLWFEDMDLSVEINPPTVETDETITVFAVVDDGVCLSEPVEIELIVLDIGNAGEGGNITLCIGNPNPQDLFGALNGSPTLGGTWSDDSGAGVDLTDPTNVSFADVDDGTYTFTYAFSGVPGCPESSAVITVLIDPPIELDIINQECSPDDLFLIVDFIISTDGDVSTDVGTLTNTGGLSYQLQVMTDEFEFTITITNPLDPDCSYEYEFDIPECGCQLIPMPDVEPLYTICEGDAFPELDALDDVNFSANWFDESGVNIILADSEDFIPSAAGIYFVQAFDILDPNCTSDLIEFEVIVEVPSFAGTDSTLMICQNSSVSVDFISLLGPNPDMGGSWTDVQMTGVDLTDLTSVDLSGLPIGSFNYIYGFDSDVCPNSSATIAINVTPGPNAGMNVDTTICIGQVSIIDLPNMIAPADIGGTWEEASGLIDLSLPTATNVSAVPPGIYTIQYIIPGMPLTPPFCDSVSSTIMLTIEESASAGSDNLVSECIGPDLNLANYLVGNSTLGIFESLDPAIALAGAVFSTNGLPEADYLFYHIVTSQNSCPADTAMITVSLGNQLSAGMDVSESICATQNFDLNNLLNGADLGGSFILETDNTIINGGIFDATLFGGQSITVIYEIGGGSCPIDTAMINLDITDQPSFSVSPNEDMICASDCALFSLMTSFTQGVMVSMNLVNESGQIVDDQDILLNGDSSFEICNIANGQVSVFDLEPDQNYTLELESFTFMGCTYDLDESIMLTSESSGELDYSDELCSNQTIELGGVEFNAMNPSGTVFIPVANACDSVINVDLTFIEPIESFINGQVCSNFSILVNGTNYNVSNTNGVEQIPNGSTTGCDSTIFINLDFSLENETLEINESLCEGDFIQVGNDIYDETNPSGETTLFANSQFNCDTVVTVNLSFGDAYTVNSVPVCADNTTGSIEINGNQNNLPLSLFVDDVSQGDINSLPYSFDLPLGAYTISVMDQQGCTVDQNIIVQPTVIDFIIMSTSLGSDMYDLFINTSVMMDSIIWSGDPTLDCQNCFETSTGSIVGTQEVTATGYYGNGCSVSSSIVLTETISTEIFVPNILNPGTNSVNNSFYLQSESDYLVNEISIFDRWGNVVFTNANFQTNDPTQAWDGRFSGSIVASGVYVYYGEVEIPGEGVRKIEGSITIVR